MSYYPSPIIDLGLDQGVDFYVDDDVAMNAHPDGDVFYPSADLLPPPPVTVMDDGLIYSSPFGDDMMSASASAASDSISSIGVVLGSGPVPVAEGFAAPLAKLPTRRHVVSGYTFALPIRYSPIKIVGTGAYGVVLSANDEWFGTTVAVKKISHCLQDLRDTRRILREIRLLNHFRHDNVLSLVDVFVSDTFETFQDVYLVSPLMDTDLQLIISSQQDLTEQHVQWFVFQMLRGLKAIHQANVLHRDLKPSNLIVNADCDLKVCDFGLARVADPNDDFANYLTEYVATRWYRAPEVILSWKQYTKAIDVWSVGCIMAELLGKRPLFPGSSHLNQIAAITDVLGSPPPDEFANIGSEAARRFVQQMGYKPRVSFAQLYPNCSPLGLDLLEQLLQFDPSKRISAEQALYHPYLDDMHDGVVEPPTPAIFNFDFEEYELIPTTFRHLLWQEMTVFHPELALR